MKLKFKKIFDNLNVFLFSIAVFSIPSFSWTEKYYVITWVFTIAFIFSSLISLLFFYKVKIDMICISFILFIVSSFLSSLFNGFLTFGTSIYLNTMLVIFIYVFGASNKEIVPKLFKAAWVGLLIFLLYFIYVYRTELLSLQINRLGSAFGDVNDISVVMAIGFSLSLCFLFSSKKWNQILIYSFVAFAFLLLSFTTGSKIVLLIYPVLGILFLFLKLGKKRWFISFGISVLLVVLFIVLLNIPIFSTLKERFAIMLYTFTGINLGYTNIDYSSIERMNMFYNGISLFARKPLFGFGQEGFKLFSTYHNGWSHNHLSDSLCNYGMVGTLFFHAPIIFWFKQKKQNKKTFFGSLFVYVAFFVSMTSVALFREKIFTFIYPLLLSSFEQEELFAISLTNKRIKLIFSKEKVKNYIKSFLWL